MVDPISVIYSKDRTISKNVKSKRLAQQNRTNIALFLRSGLFLIVICVYCTGSKGLPLNESNSDYEGNLIFSSKPKVEIFTSSHTSNQEGPANCIQPAINEFPSDGLTRDQRQHGWIVIHVIITLYCFWSLAIICDDYFVSAIDQICSTLKMRKDVVGATFMAAATASPELFMNVVGTFVTKGDIGVGAIVGSSVFNILAVPACCGLFVGRHHIVQLCWWPLTRDCLLYCIAVLGLLYTVHDGKVMWYEGLALVICYFLYMIVMYNNDKMHITARKLILKYRRFRSHVVPRIYREVNVLTPLLTNGKNCTRNNNVSSKTSLLTLVRAEEVSTNILNDDEIDYAANPWQREERCLWEYVLRWPIIFLLWSTIPNSRKYPRWKYLTLVMSVIWIGLISFLAAFAITVIGDTLSIPDSVMGLTILAAGMGVPEAISSIIVSKQGQGAMGISNSIGSNTFDILLCLGLPWFLKAYFLPTHADQNWVELNSGGLIYTVGALLVTLLGVYVSFVVNKFVLDWKLGISCVIIYIVFLIIATMIELNIFFPVNLPVCKD